MRFRTGKGSDHLWLEGHGLDLENSHFLRLVKEQLDVEHLSGGDVSRNEKVFYKLAISIRFETHDALPRQARDKCQEEPSKFNKTSAWVG